MYMQGVIFYNEAFPGVWETREHVHLFSGNKGTLAFILGNKGTKLILGTGNKKILKIT